MAEWRDFITPYESSEFVMKHAKNVSLCEDGINKLSEMIYNSFKTAKSIFYWRDFESRPKKMNESAVNWIFFIDSINFSFWDLPSKTHPTDYESSCTKAQAAAVSRAIDEGYPITNSEYYWKISEKELRHILRSDSPVEIPLIEERLRKFQGRFVNCVESASCSAVWLLQLVVDNFPTFRDEVVFNGRTAQLLVSETWRCFEGNSYGKFDDIDQFTMFADYQVPQTLRYYNALVYSAELDKFIDENKLMRTGDLFEVELRAATIIACRKIRDKVRDLVKQNPVNLSELNNEYMINDIIIDSFLWHYGDKNKDVIDKTINFHKIRTIFY